MKKYKWLFRTAITLVVLGILCLCGATFLPVHGEEAVYDAVIRLHVLANSDTDADQALKLRVRDAVLEYSTAALAGAATREEAAEKLTALLPELESRAQESVKEAGYAYPVTVLLGQEEYPTRVYESCCFPAGEYLSLRVVIGEGEGHNWWCVLFPPCCRAAAGVSKAEMEEEFIAVGLTKDQYSIITETENTRYRLRFRFLEAFEKWLR